MSTSVRSRVSRTSTAVRCSTSTAAALEFKDVNISPFLGSRIPTSARGSTSTATTCRAHRVRDRALSGWDSSATTTPPCSGSSHRDRPWQLRARPLCSPLLGRTGDRAADFSQVVAGRPRRVHRRAAAQNLPSETWPRTWSSGSSSLSRADLAEVGTSGRRATLSSGTSARTRSSPMLRDDQNTVKRVHRDFALAGG